VRVGEAEEGLGKYRGAEGAVQRAYRRDYTEAMESTLHYIQIVRASRTRLEQSLTSDMCTVRAGALVEAREQFTIRQQVPNAKR
jgi:hypothetical protein